MRRRLRLLREVLVMARSAQLSVAAVQRISKWFQEDAARMSLTIQEVYSAMERERIQDPERNLWRLLQVMREVSPGLAAAISDAAARELWQTRSLLRRLRGVLTELGEYPAGE